MTPASLPDQRRVYVDRCDRRSQRRCITWHLASTNRPVLSPHWHQPKTAYPRSNRARTYLARRASRRSSDLQCES